MFAAKRHKRHKKEFSALRFLRIFAAKTLESLTAGTLAMPKHASQNIGVVGKGRALAGVSLSKMMDILAEYGV